MSKGAFRAPYAMSKTDLAQLTARDDAVPPAWVRRLRQQVVRCHARPGTLWYPLDSPPRTFFEQVIGHLRTLMELPASCCGAEYWMRAQPANSGLWFHFDRDEAIRTSIVCPSISSILYLSDVGGPTLVVDLRPDSRAQPKHGAGMLPRRGRYATFPGALLHGVQRSSPSRWPRIAFFVNWWSHQPKHALERLPAPILRGSPVVPSLKAADTVRPKRCSSFSFDAAALLDASEWRTYVAGLRELRATS
jgi:hypothetical protein